MVIKINCKITFCITFGWFDNIIFKWYNKCTCKILMNGWDKVRQTINSLCSHCTDICMFYTHCWVTCWISVSSNCPRLHTHFITVQWIDWIYFTSQWQETIAHRSNRLVTQMHYLNHNMTKHWSYYYSYITQKFSNNNSHVLKFSIINILSIMFIVKIFNRWINFIFIWFHTHNETINLSFSWWIKQRRYYIHIFQWRLVNGKAINRKLFVARCAWATGAQLVSNSRVETKYELLAGQKGAQRKPSPI